MSELRFDCPELGFYNMTDAEMIAELQSDAAKGDNYAAACLLARGIGVASATTTEGRGSEGEEPGPEDAPKVTG